jgi:hypothetical protein
MNARNEQREPIDESVLDELHEKDDDERRLGQSDEHGDGNIESPELHAREHEREDGEYEQREPHEEVATPRRAMHACSFVEKVEAWPQEDPDDVDQVPVERP